MRPSLINWLLAHNLPAWLAPDYATTVGLAGVLGAALVLWLTRRDGADIRLTARALAVGYAAAWLGGYVIELLRVLLVAAITGEPLASFGRAAYGGLLAGLLATAWMTWRGKQPVVPLLDRLTPVLGLSFALVRSGCFLAGCDYGKPTALAIGVRFPAGSNAALDHAARGWIPAASASLPLHPTQLYEAAVGILASAVAAVWLARGDRDGRAIRSWLAIYALGRFSIERLRDDASRGIYGPLSSAQIISIAILLGLAIHQIFSLRRARLQEVLGSPA